MHSSTGSRDLSIFADSLRPRTTRDFALICLCFSIAVSAQVNEGWSQHPEGPSPALDPPLGHRYASPPPVPEPARETSPADATPELQDGTALDLQALLNLACQHNPTLCQARAQIDAAMGTAIQAGLYPNPEVAYAAEQIGVKGIAGEFHGAIVRQEIVTGGKLRLSRAKYLERVSIAEALALGQQYRVCNDIRIHYYDALGRGKAVEIHRDLVRSAEDAALTARELYNVGQANQTMVLRSNVRLQRARLDALAAENQYRRSIRALTSLIGIEFADLVLEDTLDGVAEPIDFDAALQQLWQNSPQLIAARAKLRSDQFTVQREHAQPIPNLHFEGGVGYNFEAEETVAVAGVGVKLPLWDRNQGTIQQAHADLARQQAEIARLEMLLRRELADTYQQYLTALQHVVQYRQVMLPDLREAYRISLQSYKQNRTDWPQVLDVQGEYFQARLAMVDSLVAWRKAEVLINGMLLHGGLMPAQGPLPAGHIDATPHPR